MSNTTQRMTEENSPPEEPLVGLSDDVISAVHEAIQEEEKKRTFALLEPLSPADMANLLEKSSSYERNQIIKWFSDQFKPEMFLFLDKENIRLLFKEMQPAEIARIVAELDTDDAIDLLEPLNEEFRKTILRRVSQKIRAQLEEGFTFPEDSAGRMMQRSFVAVPEFWTVGKTLDYMRLMRDDLPIDFYDIFVVDPMHHMVGELPLHTLARHERSTRISTLMRSKTHTIPVMMDQEEVAHIFRRDVVVSAPVVDDDGRVIGAITIDDIVHVVDEEAQEDILKLGGVNESDTSRTVFSTVKSRFSWLVVNLLTAVLASWCIGQFDQTLEKIVALAILMPIVASMGGNAGTQAMTVAVRALATKQLSGINAARVIGKETIVGAINGVAFAVLSAIITVFWFGDIKIGLIIGGAMIANLIVACFAGVSIPLVLQKMKIDPALASGVFLTTVTDIVGFVVFLGLGAMFLL